MIRTGPSKFLGTTVRDFLGIIDQSKENFFQQVVAERGDKLRISREELLKARIYNGNEAVRLGLVDSVGGDTEAIEKAASLAGISNYELVDINTEVFRILNKKLWRTLEPLEPLFTSAGDQQVLTQIRSLMTPSSGTGDNSRPLDGVTTIDMLRRLYLPWGSEEAESEINLPRIDHLYVGPSQ